MSKTSEALKKSKLFSNISDENLEKYSIRMNERSLLKGEILVNEGDSCEGLYMVSEGNLALQKYAIDGDYVSLQLLEVGNCTGQEFFFGTRDRYTYSVEAVTNAEVIYVPKDVLISIMREDEQMKKNFLRLLSNMVNGLYTRIDILSQRNLSMKITHYLLYLLSKQDEEINDLYGDIQERSSEATPFVELPVSKEVTAKLLAMPRPSFSRELVRMEKEDLIKVNGRIIWLTDLEALIMMGEDN